MWMALKELNKPIMMMLRAAVLMLYSQDTSNLANTSAINPLVYTIITMSFL